MQVIRNMNTETADPLPTPKNHKKTNRLMPEAQKVLDQLCELMGVSLDLCVGTCMSYTGRSRSFATGFAVFGEDQQTVTAAVRVLYLWARSHGHVGKYCQQHEARRNSYRNPAPVSAALGVPIDEIPTGPYRGMVEVTRNKIDNSTGF